MINYGGRAQVFFDYKTDDLANRGIEDYQVASTDDMVVPAFDKDALNQQLEPYGLSYYGASLVLKTETSLKLYFKKLDNYSGNVTAKINGKETELIPNSTSYVVVDVADIPSSSIGNIWDITIGDVTFQYSATNYIQNQLNGSDENLKAVVTAVYDYYLAALNYFGY